MNLASWARNYERVFNVMNLQSWAKNYQRLFGIIHFNLKQWSINYEEKILQPRILKEEIQALKTIEEKYNKERRERLQQRRAHLNNVRIKHQVQELEAMKRLRQEERPRDIPLYCAAPGGGAFDFDEPQVKPGLYSVEPTDEWLSGFSQRSKDYKPLVDQGEPCS